MTHQIFEQGKFFCGQFDRFVAAPDGVGDRIQDQVRYLK
jgi:hypothetical protein